MTRLPLLLTACLLAACSSDEAPTSAQVETSAPAGGTMMLAPRRADPAVDPDLLSRAALHNLGDRLTILGGCYSWSCSERNLQESRESITRVRAWAGTLTDADYRDAVLHWTDHAERKADEYERDLRRGPDPEEAERGRKNREEWRAIEALARTLPKPPREVPSEGDDSPLYFTTTESSSSSQDVGEHGPR